ncbi:MAG: helix-turn-helix transcriptional regulator [Symploca sp. SIO2E6]|nr:helix-turn-helix transcriptional regulator [Symploca sp. SIO2E6]
MLQSLRVSPGCIELVKSAVRRNSFPRQKALADEVGLALATVKNFLNGKPVDFRNLVEISEVLGLDWRDIAAHTEPPPPTFYLETCK